MIRLIHWGALALILTVVFGTGYVVAQQIERSGADDGPLRAASQLAADPSGATNDTVDLARSGAVFTIVFDAQNRPISGSARLNGSLPTVPAGVLDRARTSRTNRVSWEPTPGLRFATVEQKAGSTVILAGQSLGPSESRTDQLGLLIGAGWLVGLVICAGGFLLERARLSWPS